MATFQSLHEVVERERETPNRPYEAHRQAITLIVFVLMTLASGTPSKRKNNRFTCFMASLTN